MRIKTLLLTLLLLSDLAFGARLINRNILDVDNYLYTQRDFEIYKFTKEALFYRSESKLGTLNAKNWTQELESFKNQMLINGLFNRESQRLLSFLPNGDMIAASSRLLRKSINRSEKLKKMRKSLKIVDEELEAQVIIILKVQAYLKSKANKVDREFWYYTVERESSWFRKISESIPYRYYEGAEKHLTLTSLK